MTAGERAVYPAATPPAVFQRHRRPQAVDRAVAV